MKKNFLLGFIAFAALAVTSCTNDDVNEFIPQGKAIEFSTYVGRDAQARGVETTPSTLRSGFGVYAYLHNGTTTYANANFLANEKVYDTPWKYDHIKYWPKEASAEVDFLAYGPYNLNASVANGVLTYTVNETAANQEDLVVAAPLKNKKSGVVEFTFQHMLSRVGFTLHVEGQASSTINSVSFTGTFKNQCKVNMTTTPLATAEFGDAAAHTYTLNSPVATDYLMIVPQTLTADVTINYSVTYAGDVTVTSSATASLTGFTFAQGKAYTINANVQGEAITFSVDEANFGDWDQQTPQDVTFS